MAGKKFKAALAQVEIGKLYLLADAIALCKKIKPAKFDETVEVTMVLGVDPRKADQMVRGTIVLPHGLGKSKKVAVIAGSPEKQREAQDAGADEVGGDDLVDKIKGGYLNFDALIATPDMMRSVGTLGKVLGPRGLMPNPKVGTVTMDVATAVKNAKAGQVQYRTDKTGIVHCTLGRASFSVEALQQNCAALIDALQKARPSGAKGQYLKKVSLSSTMGIGVTVDQSTLAL